MIKEGVPRHTLLSVGMIMALLGMPFSHVYLITTFLLFLMYMPLVGLDTL